MSSGAKSVNVIRLLTTFDLKIKVLPDNLKCVECKSVLKDACQMPCGCRICRACVDDVRTSGRQFCPGGSEECGGALLINSLPDYKANKSISRLSATCPHTGCLQECSLADMEDHLRICMKNSVICPFRELGCHQCKLAVDEMGDHLQQESLSHSEILIRTIANINRNMGVLKQKGEASVDEMKKLKCKLALKDEQIRMIIEEMRQLQKENKSIKNENKSINNENNSIKDEIVFIKNENKAIKHEIKTIKNENKSIKEENDNLFDRLKILSERLEQEIDRRRVSGERDSTRISGTGPDLGVLGVDVDPDKGDIGSILQMKSIHVPAWLEHVDASCDEWAIDYDFGKTIWGWNWSSRFTGVTRPYQYQLQSVNSMRSGGDVLLIELLVLPGDSDSFLPWPFIGAVTVMVADKGDWGVYMGLTRQCRIERPSDNHFSCSDPFEFPHSKLRAAGLKLDSGLWVSCQIVPDVIR